MLTVLAGISWSAVARVLLPVISGWLTFPVILARPGETRQSCHGRTVINIDHDGGGMDDDGGGGGGIDGCQDEMNGALGHDSALYWATDKLG